MEDGPPRFPRGFPCPTVLGYLFEGGRRGRNHPPTPFRIRDYHPLWFGFPSDSAMGRLCNSPGLWLQSQNRPHDPDCATPASFNAAVGLGCSPFARRYLGNRGCFLFLRVLRCFSSPRSPPFRDARGLALAGFPIRKSPDQCLLAAPRGLSQLSTSFIAYRRQGIHRVPLLA